MISQECNLALPRRHFKTHPDTNVIKDNVIIVYIYILLRFHLLNNQNINPFCHLRDDKRDLCE